MKELKDFIRISQKHLKEYITKKEEDIEPDRIYPFCKARDYVIEDIELDNCCDDIYYHLANNKEFVEAFRALLGVL